MTLIVATDEPDGGFAALQTISELVREHPSRGIVLAVSEQAEHGLEARVLAQCWKPFGKAQQICCEQIEITARPDYWPNVGPTLTGLIAADLPVIFWCRHKAALSPSATKEQKAGLEAVMSLATKTIIDSKCQDVPSALELLSKWRNRGRTVADLEWTRLTPWREPIAHTFDSPEFHLSQFHSVEIAHGDKEPCASVLYAGSWLSAPYKPSVTFTRIEGRGSGLQRITLISNSARIDFERTGDCMTLRTPNGRDRKYNYKEASADTLMTEELSVVGHDPAFDSAFERAQELLHA
jgi:glucose-6-phosphate dehydrogenase assembly protein OpcA